MKDDSIQKAEIQGHFSKACLQIYKNTSITAISLVMKDAHQDKNRILFMSLG